MLAVVPNARQRWAVRCALLQPTRADNHPVAASHAVRTAVGGVGCEPLREGQRVGVRAVDLVALKARAGVDLQWVQSGDERFLRM